MLPLLLVAGPSLSAALASPASGFFSPVRCAVISGSFSTLRCLAARQFVLRWLRRRRRYISVSRRSVFCNSSLRGGFGGGFLPLIDLALDLAGVRIRWLDLAASPVCFLLRRADFDSIGCGRFDLAGQASY